MGLKRVEVHPKTPDFVTARLCLGVCEVKLVAPSWADWHHDGAVIDGGGEGDAGRAPSSEAAGSPRAKEIFGSMRTIVYVLLSTLPVLLPTSCADDAISFCACGIARGSVCCDGSCGTCGGSGCGSRPGGASRCCSGSISSNGVYCVSNTQVVCNRPPPPPPPLCGENELLSQYGTCDADINSPAAATISLGADGRLLYTANTLGDTIPDFASVGYRYDVSSLPTVPAIVQVPAIDGESDATARLQSAIDQVAARQRDPSTGFRGAVQLGSGTFRVNATLRIAASGLVLRGAGDGDGGTILRATAPRQYTVVQVGGAATYHQPSGSGVAIVGGRVPVGARTINVSSVTALGAAVGDLVIVRRQATAAWISSIGMDAIQECTPPLPGRDCSQWDASRYVMDFERVVRAVDGNTLTLDAALVEAIEAGHGHLYLAIEQRIKQIGVESLRFRSDFDATITQEHSTYYSAHPETLRYHADEEHGWTALAFDNVLDGWARSVHCQHFGFSCVHVQRGAKRVSVENATSTEPVSLLTGGRRYSFYVTGQLTLVRHCHSDAGRHSYVIGSVVLGPNVFVHCTSTHDHSDIGPHHRWGVGQLYDGIVGGQMRVWDRGNFGSGHGWAGNQVVFWNCRSLASLNGSHGFVVETPSGGANYCVGCYSDSGSYGVDGPWCCGTSGQYQSLGEPIADIPSLYYAQRSEQPPPLLPPSWPPPALSPPPVDDGCAALSDAASTCTLTPEQVSSLRCACELEWVGSCEWPSSSRLVCLPGPGLPNVRSR